ncbi:uncharacterized protein LOC113550251 [Rhopalosiphum maidis]|uniref:uncharacterized protein LOC113550251 n=1 Tax=Rhopalosiphum maidis TaxID=43146 RepID=UPI000EFFE8FB|nr:uncharacterized protein LOC113550251 [Rhopalosiphum maidis]
MKLIQIFALSVVVLYLTQENKTNGFKIIKIPIYTVKGIIWITIKVPAKFVWNILRFPTKIIINLAWILSKRPIKMITPQYLQYTINQLVEEYEIERKKRKKEKSIRHRMKVSIKKGISKMNNGLERFDRKVFWVLEHYMFVDLFL